MLTLRAKYKDGLIKFIDPVPFSGYHEVLVTFLTPDYEIPNFISDELKELKALIRESGLLLTKREMEILRLVQTGANNDDIANQLGISNGSVRNQLSSVYAKLKVKNRTEAIHKAMRIGLLDPVESIFD